MVSQNGPTTCVTFAFLLKNIFILLHLAAYFPFLSLWQTAICCRVCGSLPFSALFSLNTWNSGSPVILDWGWILENPEKLPELTTRDSFFTFVTFSVYRLLRTCHLLFWLLWHCITFCFSIFCLWPLEFLPFAVLWPSACRSCFTWLSMALGTVCLQASGCRDEQEEGSGPAATPVLARLFLLYRAW